MAGVEEVTDAELVERAVRSAILRRKRGLAWSAVSNAFGLGSTLSEKLCRRFGIDPETGREVEKEPAA
jgi:hypothetical protein